MARHGRVSVYRRDSNGKYHFCDPRGNYSRDTTFVLRYEAERAKSPVLQAWFWIAEYVCRFLAGLIAGVLAGYAFHVMLDSFTPASPPVF